MIEVQWLATNETEAKTVAKILIEKKLIACANLIPNVTSLYIWEDKLEESQEVLCLFKALDEKYPEIEKTIARHCTYEIPAIIKVQVDGYRPYLNWVKERLC